MITGLILHFSDYILGMGSNNTSLDVLRIVMISLMLLMKGRAFCQPLYFT